MSSAISRTSTNVRPRGVMAAIRTIHQRPSRQELIPFMCSARLGNARDTQANTTMLATATRRMPYRLMKWSRMSSTYSPLVVLKKTRLTTAAGAPTATVAPIRESSNLSRTAEITTSMTLTSEVTPAKTRDPKKSTPISAPAGASLMIAGKATNANPSPSAATSSTATPDACAMKPSAAKTPIPASSSKPEFDRPTTSADPDMSVFRSTYEEYVIMIPNPTDSEKKIWPKAAAHTDGSFSVDQFGANSAS